jgi:hypothetical protein
MAEFGAQETYSGFKAGADLSVKQYHFVRASADHVCNQASLATASSLLGVLQNKPKTDEAATIAYFGESKVVAGGAITANVLITSNSSGRAAAAASGDMICGRALEAAGADGEVINALIFPPVRLSGAV